MNRAPAGAILALPTWNNFGNACLQDAWILLYWEQSPESSGWAQIGKMSTQQCIWKQVPTSASFGGGKCLWAFLSQHYRCYLPDFSDSPWSGTLGFSACSLGQREMDSPYPAFAAIFLHTQNAHSDLMLPATIQIHQSQQFTCVVLACSCWGWVSSATTTGQQDLFSHLPEVRQT